MFEYFSFREPSVPCFEKRIRFKEPSGQVISKLLIDPSVSWENQFRTGSFRGSLFIYMFSLMFWEPLLYIKTVLIYNHGSQNCVKKQITGHEAFSHSTSAAPQFYQWVLSASSGACWQVHPFCLLSKVFKSCNEGSSMEEALN